MGREESYGEFGSGHWSARNFDKPANGRPATGHKPAPATVNVGRWLATVRQPAKGLIVLSLEWRRCSPPPTDATKQALDSTTCNLWIHNVSGRDTRGRPAHLRRSARKT